MKTLLTAFLITAVVFLVIGSTAVGSNAVCLLNCPAGDGGPTGPGVGNKSPDLNSDGIVDLIDLSIFATAFLGAYNYCADYNCDGVIDLIDLSLFAPHWQHQGVPGFCQPAVDHYKPYDLFPPTPIFQGPITLNDQFGSTTHTIMQLMKMATPADKNAEGMIDPLAHQTWYEFFNPEPPRQVIAQDQFGEFDWLVMNSRYLVMPALKFPEPGQGIPQLNHYKCYEAFGPFIGIPVSLRDQFGEEIVVVLEGLFFCNPTEKVLPDGTLYPIIDHDAHLTCYGVDNPHLYGFQVIIRDQFFVEIVALEKNTLLCLPAVKKEWFEQPVNWNKIKALYETD
jgi:hypothetical protein